MFHRFGRLIGLLLVVQLGVMLGLHGTPARAAAPGFHVSNGRVLDANNNDFVMRGINHAYTWYPTQTSAIANIKQTGANTVRVVLSSGDRWPRVTSSNVASIIQQCRANRLICVLEVHDTTGYGEQSGAATLDQAVDYWISIKSVLEGQEAFVILNIGNEPIGNNASAQWIAATKGAIQRMRSAGFQHQLMVDAPNWGQDWTMTMRDNAAAVFASDSKANTIFSVHMYGVYNTAAKVQSYIQTFVDARLPLVVGEFGSNHSDGDPDEDAIMSSSKNLGIGYLGWSWSGNGGGVEYLDLVTNFHPAQLTPWGERLINGANGIRATSREASVFGPTATPTRVPPTATRVAATATRVAATPTRVPPTATPGGQSGCKVAWTIVNQWGDGFNVDVRITNLGSAINGWNLRWSFGAGQRIVNGWNATITQSGSNITATNAAWNSSIPKNGSVSFGFQASYSGANPIPSTWTLNGTRCQ